MSPTPPRRLTPSDYRQARAAQLAQDSQLAHEAQLAREALERQQVQQPPHPSPARPSTVGRPSLDGSSVRGASIHGSSTRRSSRPNFFAPPASASASLAIRSSQLLESPGTVQGLDRSRVPEARARLRVDDAAPAEVADRIDGTERNNGAHGLRGSEMTSEQMQEFMTRVYEQQENQRSEVESSAGRTLSRPKKTRKGTAPESTDNTPPEPSGPSEEDPSYDPSIDDDSPPKSLKPGKKGKTTKKEDEGLRTLDMDYMRPCSTTGTPLVDSSGANEKRRQRIRHILIANGTSKQLALTVPNQDKVVWSKETRAVMWRWAEMHIEGWVGHYRGGIQETGATRQEDVVMKKGKGGVRSLSTAQLIAAADARTEAKKYGSWNGKAMQQRPQPGNGDPAPSSSDSSEGEPESESDEDATPEDEARRAAAKEEARQARHAARRAAKLPQVRSYARDADGSYTDRFGRDYDRMYDTEEASDTEPFSGFFTSWANVPKKVAKEPDVEIYALVKKSKRKIDGGQDDLLGPDGTGKIKKKDLGEFDLEQVGRLKRQRP